MQITISKLLETLSHRQELKEQEMRYLLDQLISGQATPAQVGGLLMSLHTKGETSFELYTAAKYLRDLATPICLKYENLIDIVGTGGDNSHSFNISTVSAFVVAAAGAKVAKHGNTSISSRSGSADFLRSAGAELSMQNTKIKECIQDTGVAFLFAPNFHTSLKKVSTLRKELGVRTIFNLLGPLINPAFVTKQVIGVYAKRWLQPFAEAAQKLGSSRVMIVHAEDGLDEISIGAPTHVVELKEDKIQAYQISPEDFSLRTQNYECLRVKNAEESLTLAMQVLSNEAGAARDIIALNAGAAIYVAGLCPNLQEGVKKALAVLASGEAKKKFDDFIAFTRST